MKSGFDQQGPGQRTATSAKPPIRPITYIRKEHQDERKQIQRPCFFEKYNQMARSRQGLSAAGEWQTLEPLLPDFAGKEVLDLGCGYGWHLSLIHI